MTPQVTVAVPTWNRAALLAKTIRSVLGQTLADLELWVLDDASTDDTAEVVASFDDPRLHYDRAERRFGLHGNLTRCLQIGEAPYVAICQDDDLMLPANLEHLVPVLDQNPNVGLVHAAFHLIDGAEQILQEGVDWFSGGTSTVESGRAFLERAMNTENRINMSSAVIRRSVVEGLAFEETDGPGTDVGMWLRIADRADIAFVAETLTLRRLHTGSVSSQLGIYDARRLDLQTFDQTRNIRAVKERFLIESGFDQDSIRRFRNTIHRCTRRELLNLITRRTLPNRSFSDTWPLFREAVRIEPSLLRYPRTARVLLASLAGERVRNTVRSARGST